MYLSSCILWKDMLTWGIWWSRTAHILGLYSCWLWVWTLVSWGILDNNNNNNNNNNNDNDNTYTAACWDSNLNSIPSCLTNILQIQIFKLQFQYMNVYLISRNCALQVYIRTGSYFMHFQWMSSFFCIVYILTCQFLSLRFLI